MLTKGKRCGIRFIPMAFLAHTGKTSEAVIDLPQPLVPGQILQLDTFYSGTLAASAGRLERLGIEALGGIGVAGSV